MEYPEFRLLMVMLRRYIELYCAFDHIDSGDDNRIDLEVRFFFFINFAFETFLSKKHFFSE